MHFHFGDVNSDVVVFILVVFYDEKDADRQREHYNDRQKARLSLLPIIFFQEFHFSSMNKFEWERLQYRKARIVPGSRRMFRG